MDFLLKSKETAFFKMLKPEIEWSGYEFELENREALKLEWEESYSVQYDFRKAAFEYSINKNLRSF